MSVPSQYERTIFTLAEAFEVLERTPAALDGLLRNSSAAWHHADEGAGTWSPFVVVGHLIHAEETNWIPRARMILEQGPDVTFTPFDRFAQLERFGDWSLDQLLDRFAEVRHSTLHTARGWDLTGEQLALEGRHPELGAVTLGQLLATWAVHDLTHLSQIVRVMAKRYADAVGPWRAYLSVLQH